MRVGIDPETGDYRYRYDGDFAFRHPGDDVTFNLINEIPNATATIIKHVSSDGTNPSNGNPQSKLHILDVATGQPTSTTLAYNNSNGVQKVRFKLNYGKIVEHDWVYIALIVLIRRGTEPDFLLLCDPQIGNGPP